VMALPNVPTWAGEQTLVFSASDGDSPPLTAADGDSSRRGGTADAGDLKSPNILPLTGDRTTPYPPISGRLSPPLPRGPVATPPDLAAVIDAWPALPEPIRAGILAMVRAAAPGDRGGR